MAKYYIQSGDVQFVVNAADAEGGALWVLNQTINRLLPSETIEDLNVNQRTMRKVVQCLEVLGNEFHVSEIGFGRSDIAILDTEILFKRWYELICAMNHLLDQLDQS